MYNRLFIKINYNFMTILWYKGMGISHFPVPQLGHKLQIKIFGRTEKYFV